MPSLDKSKLNYIHLFFDGVVHTPVAGALLRRQNNKERNLNQSQALWFWKKCKVSSVLQNWDWYGYGLLAEVSYLSREDTFTTVVIVGSIVRITQVHVSTVVMMTCHRLWVSGEVTGADVEFIRAVSAPLSFVPRPPSLLWKALGVDLSRPSGYRLIESRDWEVLHDSKYMSV